ncbi:hypothetical protein OHA25_03545 [Nonomuraea sp. NBC_00507]|uniref:hypothetical protein n=1 Tax=Nonomuraea sp. NBC_00507 TaxID=2976002 RepID=UPI002E183D6C
MASPHDSQAISARWRVVPVGVAVVSALALLLAAIFGFIEGAQVGLDDSLKDTTLWMFLWATATIVPLSAAIAIIGCAAATKWHLGKRLAPQLLILAAAGLIWSTTTGILAELP